MPEALEHLRVIELCDGLQGAFCGKQFAAWGARVTLIEPPSGHRLRQARPAAEAADGTRVSLLWEYLAGRKHSMVAEPDRDQADAVRVREELSRADVFVTDWRPVRLRAAGFDNDTLSVLNRRLVIVHLSPFGLSGPYADYDGTDLITQALSGFMSFNGLPDREPVKAPANLIAFFCGVNAFVGAMAVLRERRLSGQGQCVECADIEALATIIPYLRVEYYGTPSQRTGTTGTGNDSYETADGGWVYFSLAAENAWQSFLAGCQIDLESVPEELRTVEGRGDRERLKAFIAGVVRGRSALDLFLTLSTLRMTTGILFTPEDLCENPQLEARGFLHKLQQPKLATMTVAGAPAQMSATPMAPPGLAPAAGDAGSAMEPAPDPGFPSPRLAPRAPLEGVRILDLTAAWIGTYATMLLGDLGADIIKVESPTRPDVWRGGEGRGRGAPPCARPEAHIWNVNVNFNSVNRNKRSTCLDLDTPEGKELFLRLAERADFVTENYTPRVMANFCLGYDDLRKVNEDLIMVSFSGFGATGPYADFRAIGASTEMFSGWDSLLGYPDAPPIMLGAMFADAITGLQMAACALVALEHRDRTGEGQRVEGSMFEAAVGYIGEEVMRASLRPGETRPRVNRHLDLAPHGAFRCRGDDRWLTIAVRGDAEWRRLLQVAGAAAALDRSEFATNESRLANVDALEAAISAWTREQDAFDVMHRLQEAGVPAGVVLDTAEVLENEHFRARDWFIRQTHPDLGTHRYGGFNWRFSRSNCVAKTPSPRLGEYSRQVLGDEIGLSPAETEALFAKGVTGEVLEKQAAEAGAGPAA